MLFFGLSPKWARHPRPPISSNISDVMSWNISCADNNQNGSLLNMHLWMCTVWLSHNLALRTKNIGIVYSAHYPAHLLTILLDCLPLWLWLNLVNEYISISHRLSAHFADKITLDPSVYFEVTLCSSCPLLVPSSSSELFCSPGLACLLWGLSCILLQSGFFAHIQHQ